MSAADASGRLGQLLERVRPVVHFLRIPVVSLTIVSLLFIASATYAWRVFAPEILENARHTVNASQIEITRQPDWIHTDIKKEVIRDSALEHLSLHDRQLVTKIADAFSVHSWVAEVKAVRKHPEKIVVDVEYRYPVAMVEVKTNGERGLIPVDPTGVILPTDEFSPIETRNYLRISVPEVNSFGMVGTRWRDERVVNAVKIADVWGDDWKPLHLYRIVATAPSADSFDKNIVYELQTKNQVRVIWGSPVGMEKPGEVTSSEKKARLIEYAKSSGPIDDMMEMLKLDIRAGEVQVQRARTASFTTK